MSHPFGHLGITYALHLWLIGKPVVDLIFVVIEFFRYVLRLRRCERKSVEVGVFRRGIGHFERRFQREGGVAQQPLLAPELQSDCPFVRYQNICSASFSFVTMHACDTQTNRRTELRLPRPPSHMLVWQKTKKIALCATFLGHLGVTYALHLWLVGKSVVDFMFVVIELFSLSLTVETL